MELENCEKKNIKKIICPECGKIKKIDKLKKIAEFTNFWGDKMESFKCDCGNILTFSKKVKD